MTLLEQAEKALEDWMLLAVFDGRHKTFGAPPVSDEYRTGVFTRGEEVRRQLKIAIAEEEKRLEAEKNLPPCTGTLVHNEYAPCPRCDRR